MVQALIPLLIMLLAYAAFAGEREPQTLRQVLSLRPEQKGPGLGQGARRRRAAPARPRRGHRCRGDGAQFGGARDGDGPAAPRGDGRGLPRLFRRLHGYRADGFRARPVGAGGARRPARLLVLQLPGRGSHRVRRRETGSSGAFGDSIRPGDREGGQGPRRMGRSGEGGHVAPGRAPRDGREAAPGQPRSRRARRGRAARCAGSTKGISTG